MLYLMFVTHAAQLHLGGTPYDLMDPAMHLSLCPTLVLYSSLLVLAREPILALVRLPEQATDMLLCPGQGPTVRRSLQDPARWPTRS